jgi:hypothetical protein
MYSTSGVEIMPQKEVIDSQRKGIFAKFVAFTTLNSQYFSQEKLY